MGAGAGASAGALADMYLAAQGGIALSGAANAYAQSTATRQQGKYLAQTAEQDALMQETALPSIRKAGDQAAAYRGLKTADLIGRQRVSAAGQGVDVGSQNVADAASEAAAFGAIDAEEEINNAWRQAFGVKVSATQTRRGGRDARSAANHEARMTAATGGLQFGRDVMQGAYGYEQFRKKPKEA